MLSGNRLHFTALGIIFVLALGQGEAQTQERPTQNQNESQPAKNEPAEKAAIIPPAVTAPITAAEPASKPHNQEQRAEKREESSDPLPVGGPIYFWGDTHAQWVMAVSGLSAVGISIWAVILLRGTLAATRRAVREARRTTKTAEKTVEVTRDIGQAQVRAYVSITVIRAYIEGQRLIVYARYKNTGQTPTKNLRITFTGGCSAGSAAGSPNITLGSPKKMRSLKFFPNDIIAQEERETTQGIALILEDGGSVIGNQNEVMLYIVTARIQFEDVFGVSIDERTNYWGTKKPGLTLGYGVELTRRLPDDPEA